MPLVKLLCTALPWGPAVFVRLSLRRRGGQWKSSWMRAPRQGLQAIVNHQFKSIYCKSF